MKRKLLALLLALSLSLPYASFAARDGDGMEYVSASEGFYGSLRALFTSNGGKSDTNSELKSEFSRLGIRGTHDLGNGLTGLYRYEWEVKPNDGDTGNTRIHYVGLKGAFGELKAGSHWKRDYFWVLSPTSAAQSGSGNFHPYFHGRVSNSLEYTSPRLSGFQGALRVQMNGGTDNRNLGMNTMTENETGENIDEWALAAKYGVRGFTVAGLYEVRPGAANKGGNDRRESTMSDKEDIKFWALRGGYGQDNWDVNAWYGERNDSDWTADGDDTKALSLSGEVDIGKVGLVFVHEYVKRGSGEGFKRSGEGGKGNTDRASVLNVNYKFTKKSRVWLSYIVNDYDSSSNKPDELQLGMRMDF